MNAYFVYDYYSVSGCPKAESAVMEFARKEFLYMLIATSALDAVVDTIKKYHDQVLAENRRLKSVDIRLSDERYEFEGHRLLYIGSNSLRLRKVRDSIPAAI